MLRNDVTVWSSRRDAQKGAFAPAEPYDLAVRLNGLAHGMYSLELRGALGDAYEARHHWDGAFDTMVRGLAGR